MSAVRVIAVDWSGARRPEKVLWLAEVVHGRLTQLRCGLGREAVGDLLIAEAERDPELVVGLDFAFSVPRWYLAEQGLASVRELWAALGPRAADLIASPRAPFWGRAGKAAAGLTREREFRRTDRAHPPAKSVFQLVGAGQVGSGTLHGFGLLERFADAGFAVWPFADVRTPLVVEIYPRSLLARWPGDEQWENEHARDAAVSALVLDRHVDELLALRADSEYALEGRIWTPGVVGTAG
jgi:hypothetical protein